MKPYYDDGVVTIYHGDALDVLPTIQRADCILTDPPYGIGVRYGSAFSDTRPDYWGWMRSAVESMRAASPVVMFTHRVEALRHLVGWDWIGAWTKPTTQGGPIGNAPIVPHWEPIFMYGVHTLGVRGRRMSADVFVVPNEHVDAGISGVKGRASWASSRPDGHPTPKPLALFTLLMDRMVQDSDALVVDPFVGSGTTLRAAKNLGRRVIGIEIEERYCDIAARRCAQDVLALGM